MRNCSKCIRFWFRNRIKSGPCWWAHWTAAQRLLGPRNVDANLAGEVWWSASIISTLKSIAFQRLQLCQRRASASCRKQSVAAKMQLRQTMPHSASNCDHQSLMQHKQIISFVEQSSHDWWMQEVSWWVYWEKFQVKYFFGFLAFLMHEYLENPFNTTLWLNMSWNSKIIQLLLLL